VWHSSAETHNRRENGERPTPGSGRELTGGDKQHVGLYDERTFPVEDDVKRRDADHSERPRFDVATCHVDVERQEG